MQRIVPAHPQTALPLTAVQFLLNPLVTHAWYTTDIPNIKKNEGANYIVHKTLCSACNRATFVPHPDPGVAAFGQFYCRNCSLWSQGKPAAEMKQYKVPEIVHKNLMDERFVDIRAGFIHLNR